MPEQTAPDERGQITPIEFGGKVIAAKRKCSCGGDVSLRPHPEGKGRQAICQACGATLNIGEKGQ